MTYSELLLAVQTASLTIFGTLPSKKKGTLVLLGPHEPNYWPVVCESPEWKDKAPDPVDRWSKRVIDTLATQLNATAYFPFGADPSPFLIWAQQSDRAWQSPIGMVVQSEAGLLVSYRGALEFDYKINAPTADNPCPNCHQTCKIACPVNALGKYTYDVEACQGYIREDPNQHCFSGVCLARRACPISASLPRLPEHSSYHMKAFLK